MKQEMRRPVIPAKAGIQGVQSGSYWFPAFTGMTLRVPYAILQPAPESASALAATPITLFSLFSTWRR